MSNTCYLSVYQCEGVKFDDLTSLNADLASTWGINELVDFEDEPNPPNFYGWLTQDIDGNVLISACDDHEFAGYKKSVEVWGCWSQDAAKVIAKHMTAGQLVLRFDEEGWDERYWVIEPKKAAEKKPKVTF